jgi:hypothetical protein
VLLSLVACGRGDGGADPPRKNGVEIVVLTPTHVVPALRTVFTATVAYSLAGDSTAVINYCWLPQGVELCILEEDERIVTPPSGRVELSHIRALDGPSEFIVFLSESPHPNSWDPLDRASVLVTTAP